MSCDGEGTLASISQPGLNPQGPAPTRGPTGWGLAVLGPTRAWWCWADSGRGSRMSGKPQDAGSVLRGDGSFGQRPGLESPAVQGFAEGPSPGASVRGHGGKGLTLTAGVKVRADLQEQDPFPDTFSGAQPPRRVQGAGDSPGPHTGARAS